MSTPTPPTGPATETRALAAALGASTPFTSRAGQAALHASDRHVDRWAPEHDATRKSRSLGSIAFADRILGPWMAASYASPMSRAGATVDRATPQVSWLFPRPWYQDELDWAAAAREADAQERSGSLTTRGTYLRPSGAPGQSMVAASVRPSVDQAVVVVAPESFASAVISSRALSAPSVESLSYVAPSMMASAMPSAASPGAPGGMPARAASSSPFALPAALAPVGIAAPASTPVASHALRAWTPQVSFAAAQAAELVAGASTMVAESGMSPAVRSPVLEGLAYVAPSDLASSAGASEDAPRSVASDAPRLARAAAQLSVAQQARTSSIEAASAAAAQMPAPVAVAAPSTPAPAPSPIAEAYRAEQARVVEALRAQEAVESAAATAVSSEAPVAPAVPAPAPMTEAAAQMAAFVEIARSAQMSPAAAASLRTAELVTRAALAGGAAPVSGPRVAMPAGLGGAVVGYQAAMTAYAAPHGAMSVSPGTPAVAPSLSPPIGAPRFAPPSFAMPIVAPGEPAAAEPRARDVRPFSPVWTQTAQVTPSIAAVAEARPAGIAHLGWADRWLARFAGASPASLAALDAGQERIPSVPRALAAGAPEVVFVVPMADVEQRHAQGLGLARGPVAPTAAGRPVPVATSVAAPRAADPTPTVAPAAPSALRIADDEATPDEVLHAIARAARPRVPDARIAAAASPPVAAAPVVEAPALPTVADRVARSVPASPAAGLHAQLASSPMAPALTSVLGLPDAPTFDPRALFPAGALAAYLAGAADAPALTRFALPGRPVAGQPVLDDGVAPAIAGVSTRAPAQTMIIPPAPERGADPTTTPAVEAMRRAAAPASVAAASVAAASVAAAEAATVASWQVHAPLLAAPTFAAEMNDQFDAAVATTSPTPGPIGIRELAELGATGPATAELTSLAAPLVAPPVAAWTPRPGGTAERSQQLAIAREHAAADLAFDFVSPELVLAARVYGFGPAEAAQASRLAVQGHGGLSAMASTLDLTFLRQLQSAEAGQAEPAGAAPRTTAGAGAAPRTARALPPPVAAEPIAMPTSALAAAAPAQPIVTAYPAPAASMAASTGGTVFGVERKLPRGAFLWPAGSVGAMELQAQQPEGIEMLPIAALEILAANAVASMSYVAPSAAHEPGDATDEHVITSARPSRAAGPGALLASRAPELAATGAAIGPAMSTSAPASASAEAPVAELAEAYAVPAAQRARFESVYLALSRSSDGLSLSPSVRAARALALASRPEHGGEHAPATARERAAAAWSVLPVVYALPDGPDHEDAADVVASSQGAAAGAAPSAVRTAWSMPMVAREGAAATGRGADSSLPETRAGLGALAARAGEALGSFVRPEAAEVGPAAPRRASSSSAGASASASQGRAILEPTIHELIRSGRAHARTGGGETEIPAWFESAARRMLDQRGAVDGISLAELTLIATAPTSQIAASARGGGSPAPSAPSGAGGQGDAQQGPQPDIEKLAQQIYGEILKLIDIARERSGDPWL